MLVLVVVNYSDKAINTELNFPSPSCAVQFCTQALKHYWDRRGVSSKYLETNYCEMQNCSKQYSRVICRTDAGRNGLSLSVV